VRERVYVYVDGIRKAEWSDVGPGYASDTGYIAGELVTPAPMSESRYKDLERSKRKSDRYRARRRGVQ
jgi:hypothetical protein